MRTQCVTIRNRRTVFSCLIWWECNTMIVKKTQGRFYAQTFVLNDEPHFCIPLDSNPSPGLATSPFFRIERLPQEPVYISPPAAVCFSFPSWSQQCSSVFSFLSLQKTSEASSRMVPARLRLPVSVSRRMPAVDLIEFATAALYTGEQQPIGAHHSTGFLPSLYCIQWCSQVILSGRMWQWQNGYIKNTSRLLLKGKKSVTYLCFSAK